MNKSIFLHMCCGPCACYPFERLIIEGYDVTGFWYNPNIHGAVEYQKRDEAAAKFGSIKKFAIIRGAYNPEHWFEQINSYEKPERCKECYRIRIGETAAKAKEMGVGSFTSTLLYSKYQMHDEIKEIAEDAADANNIEFVYEDFREGWQKGIDESKQLGLFRQQFCGCVFSEKERFNVS